MRRRRWNIWWIFQFVRAEPVGKTNLVMTHFTPMSNKTLLLLLLFLLRLLLLLLHTHDMR
jgi:hypothetical protein